jgi:hypothetical protein
VHRQAWTVTDLRGLDRPGPDELDVALRLRTGRPLALASLRPGGPPPGDLAGPEELDDLAGPDGLADLPGAVALDGQALRTTAVDRRGSAELAAGERRGAAR